MKARIGVVGATVATMAALLAPTAAALSSPGFCRGWLSGVDEVVDGLWCRFDRRVLCFVLRRWDVADLAVNPAVVEPVDVLGDGDLEVVDSSPRSLVAVANELGLEQGVERLGHRVVIGVAA